MPDKDPLAPYRSKRNFEVTPEPSDPGQPSAAGALRYVIQKHWATRLHYDLRLEINGTMKSWAVPKGPSYDPADKRMAVQVEDHPISYNRFEGQIPARQYGAGKVIIWDKGYWKPVGDPAEGYRKGKLKFEIHGHKLRGHWALVRMHSQADDKQPAWLLIKEHDGLERPASEFSVVDAMPDSVAHAPDISPPSHPSYSSLPLADGMTAKPSRPAKAPTRQRKAPEALPAFVTPQLATLVDSPPQDAAHWIWELKFDGYRILARLDRGTAQLFTRNGNDWTAKMPHLAKALAALPLANGWMDGEVLVLNAKGVPDFQSLQNAFDGSNTKALVFYAFDLPYANGHDLRDRPLTERRQQLAALLQASQDSHVRYSEAFEAPPTELVTSACTLGFEGVIGKRKDSRYTGKRSPDWIKLKCSHRQEFVVGGYTEPQGSRTHLGALLLGVHDAQGRLHYAGNVGTGFSQKSLADLGRQLQALRSDESPFHDLPHAPRHSHWVRPQLLAEVSFAEWTAEGKVRHAVFHGLRTDKPAQAIVQERPQSMPSSPASSASSASQSASAHLTHAERVIDTTTGITKGDLFSYYSRVAALMLPHLKGRPVSLVRAPEGIGGELFFQKHMDFDHLEGMAHLPADLYPGHPPLLEVHSGEGLGSAAQMNVVEFHTWNARKDRMDRPDRMTFDLDPGEGTPWEHVQEAATLVRTLLVELGFSAYLKTSGGKGLHVVVPIKRLHEWDTVKDFSHAVVLHLARTLPQRLVAKSGPRNRVGKIFVDYLRNGLGATTAAAWTARARPGMGISVPVAWEELDTLRSGAHWTLQSIEDRVKVGNTPWSGYEQSAVSIARAMKTLANVSMAS
ncbi:DNA ligase D [Acidovorax sp. DW039]|uniref:DNA ligase D n=1 Tax=Acidovorax sp. DW039 TaxID=3095606 RepID=UPI0030869101|nr:DNA ligase D [Acidovorax sp. DW039]